MALKYTGRADKFFFQGKMYASKKLYDKDPTAYDGSLENPIPGMTKRQALHLVEESSIHTFEDDGLDLLEKVTTPTPLVNPFVTVVEPVVVAPSKKEEGKV